MGKKRFYFFSPYIFVELRTQVTLVNYMEAS